jgi:hypothetical protein
MPVEVLFGSTRITIEVYLEAPKTTKARAPSNMAVGPRDWRASQSNECVEDEDGTRARARCRWKDPVKPKELGVVLRLGATSSWIVRGFYFFSSGPKGLRNHDGCMRHDNGRMIEA